MADIILVNKADDPMDKDANQTLFEYRSAMKYVLGGRPKKVYNHQYNQETSPSVGVTHLRSHWKRYPRSVVNHPRVYRNHTCISLYYALYPVGVKVKAKGAGSKVA